VHLLAYSTENSFLLDAAPEITFLSSSARSSTWWLRRACDQVDQKDEYLRKHLKEESLDHLFSTPPGKRISWSYLKDPICAVSFDGIEHASWHIASVELA
jgi:hypothetical protein